jgi:hypothetical protein
MRTRDTPCLMISCAQRASARAATIPQLEAHGLTVTPVLDDCVEPVPPGSNARVGARAVNLALEHDGPVLFVEDDIDTAPDFGLFLDTALDTGGFVWFYLNDRPDRLRHWFQADVAASIINREPQARRLVPARRRDFLYGSQCVLVPGDAVAEVKRLVDRGDVRAFDGVLNRAAQAYAGRVSICVPHPVQHRHDRTARTGEWRVKRSMSFDLERA